LTFVTAISDWAAGVSAGLVAVEVLLPPPPPPPQEINVALKAIRTGYSNFFLILNTLIISSNDVWYLLN
jgi:hypothetical protein